MTVCINLDRNRSIIDGVDEIAFFPGFSTMTKLVLKCIKTNAFHPSAFVTNFKSGGHLHTLKHLRFQSARFEPEWVNALAQIVRFGTLTRLDVINSRNGYKVGMVDYQFEFIRAISANKTIQHLKLHNFLYDIDEFAEQIQFNHTIKRLDIIPYTTKNQNSHGYINLIHITNASDVTLNPAHVLAASTNRHIKTVRVNYNSYNQKTPKHYKIREAFAGRGVVGLTLVKDEAGPSVPFDMEHFGLIDFYGNFVLSTDCCDCGICELCDRQLLRGMALKN